MIGRTSRLDFNNTKKTAKVPNCDINIDNKSKYDAELSTEIGAVEVSDEVPDELRSGHGKVKFHHTPEGVVGDMTDHEKDPMDISHII